MACGTASETAGQRGSDVSRLLRWRDLAVEDEGAGWGRGGGRLSQLEQDGEFGVSGEQAKMRGKGESCNDAQACVRQAVRLIPIENQY